MRRPNLQARFRNPTIGGPNTEGLSGGDRQGGGTTSLGAPQPSGMNDIDSTSASASNEAAAARQQAWNTNAANQYAQLRQTNPGVAVGAPNVPSSQAGDDAAVQHEAVRSAIAKAFGYDPKNAPPMQVLMQRWASQPAAVQAGIIKAGGAQFLDPDKGQAAIQKVTDEHDAALQKFKGQVTDLIASGKVQFDKDSQTGAVTPFTWEDDPTKPAGIGLKVKVPFTPMQQMALNSAVKDGSVPDAYGQANTAAAVAPAKQMTTDQFQSILDQRAATGNSIPSIQPAPGQVGANSPPPLTTDQFQAILNARAAGIATGAPHTPQEIVSSQNTPTSAPQVPSTPADLATSLGQSLNKSISSPTQTTPVSDLLETGADSTINGLINALNIIPRGINVIGRFTNSAMGNDYSTAQLPTIPSVKPNVEDPSQTAADLYDFTNPQGGP